MYQIDIHVSIWYIFPFAFAELTVRKAAKNARCKGKSDHLTVGTEVAMY